MHALTQFLDDHRNLTRRHFVKLGAGGLVAGGLWARSAMADTASPELAQAVAKLGSYLTPQDDFNDVSRGNPLPHSLPEEKKREVGLTQETWKLEVLSDPEHPPKLRKQLSKSAGSCGRRYSASRPTST